LRILLHELRNQQRLFWRNRESAVFVFIFPPMLFLLLGALYSDKIDGFRAADVLLVGLIGYGCANTAFAGLAITVVIRRESGVLKRIRATPLPTATYLTAVVGSTLAVFVLQMLVTIALGVALYGAKGPENRLGLIPVVLLGVACFAGLGFGAAAMIRSAEGASAVVNLIVLPMAFLSGSFGPTRRYPDVLQWLADVLPLTYLNDLLKQVYLRGDSFFGHPKDIAIVAAWGLVGLAIAWRRFGWEPRER
jgi:ABC-2 type transport system permease protein